MPKEIFEGDVAEVLFYPRCLTRREVHLVDRYLRKKYRMNISWRDKLKTVFYFIWRR